MAKRSARVPLGETLREADTLAEAAADELPSATVAPFEAVSQFQVGDKLIIKIIGFNAAQDPQKVKDLRGFCIANDLEHTITAEGITFAFKKELIPSYLRAFKSAFRSFIKNLNKLLGKQEHEISFTFEPVGNSTALKTGEIRNAVKTVYTNPTV